MLDGEQTILAIDPGSEKSAWVVLNSSGYCGQRAIEDNRVVLRRFNVLVGMPLAIEYMTPRGMPTSRDEMDTQFWAGRFVQAWGREWHPIYRHNVKTHLCNSVRANDSNIRRALIDLYGGDNKAIGGKKCDRCKGKGWSGRGRPVCPKCDGGKWKHPPGPLHKFHDDLWSALAIGITFRDTRLSEVQP